MPVATVALLQGSLEAGGLTPMVICPSGYTIIIKHISIFNLHSAEQHIDLYVLDQVMPSYHRAAHALLGPSTTGSYDVWVALEAGHAFYLGSTLGAFTYWVSGSLLSGEAPPVLPLVEVGLPSPLPASSL